MPHIARATMGLPVMLLAVATLTGTGATELGRTTWNQCACSKTWDDGDGLTCDSYCCNPDGDEAGEWCMVADPSCEDVDWGYCNPPELQAASGSATCVDIPNWKDSEGETCADYVDEMQCNENGGYGAGWDTDYGTFFDYAVDGKTAATACCGCGGGTRVNGLAQTQQCTNKPDWKDSDGDDCNAYAARAWCNSTGYGPGWHMEWGTFNTFETNGQTALTACCACAGGTRGGIESFVRETRNGCKCKTGWTDEAGKTCEGYCCNTDDDPNGEWCQVESVECEDFDWGYCRPLGHQVPYGSTCSDDPPGWADVEGDTCEDYNNDNYCTDFGGYGLGWDIQWGTFHDFMNQERTAATACCACGGGHSVWQAHLAQTCEDVPDWKDSDGDDCQGYKLMDWCNEYGMGLGWHEEWGNFESFAANGYSASEACCHCGGGSRQRTVLQTMEVGGEIAQQVVKEKPWVLPAGGMAFLIICVGCCMVGCCVCRKKEVRQEAAHVAKEAAAKVKDAVGPQRKANKYNTVLEEGL